MRFVEDPPTIRGRAVWHRVYGRHHYGEASRSACGRWSGPWSSWYAERIEGVEAPLCRLCFPETLLLVGLMDALDDLEDPPDEVAAAGAWWRSGW